MEREIGYCGCVCTECPVYLATKKNDLELREKLAAEYSTEQCTFEAMDLFCYGCHSEKTNGTKMCGDCDIRNCKEHHNRNTCADCSQFPCESIEKYVPVDSDNRKRLDGRL